LLLITKTRIRGLDAFIPGCRRGKTRTAGQHSVPFIGATVGSLILHPLDVLSAFKI